MKEYNMIGFEECVFLFCAVAATPVPSGVKKWNGEDFRKFPLSRREGRKKREALSEEGGTQSEIS